MKLKELTLLNELFKAVNNIDLTNRKKEIELLRKRIEKLEK